MAVVVAGTEISVVGLGSARVGLVAPVELEPATEQEPEQGLVTGSDRSVPRWLVRGLKGPE
ncbi:hypothetical protein [Amycolatopsis sp. NPDC050768]|uniref:hypothetical protein n=1 Tax=Amycolatopsis sp. NPDC050768 TaxID=3154839 RepID=UPI0033EC56D0